MRAELGFFGDDDCIDVLDLQRAFVQKFAGVFEKKQAVGAFPLGIGVRKMRTDVAESRRAKQRVAESVSEDVAIRVADGSFVERKRNTADDERAAFGEAMQIVADAAANRTHGVNGPVIVVRAIEMFSPRSCHRRKSGSRAAALQKGWRRGLMLCGPWRVLGRDRSGRVPCRRAW